MTLYEKRDTLDLDNLDGIQTFKISDVSAIFIFSDDVMIKSIFHSATAIVQISCKRFSDGHALPFRYKRHKHK